MNDKLEGIGSLMALVESELNNLDILLRTKKARIRTGKYAGYFADMTGVMWDKEFLVLCYVISKKGNYHLNSDTETRRFRPLRDIEIIDP